jgi:spore germination protein GerM
MLLAACSIATDDGPRTIDPASRPELNLPIPAGAGAAQGAARIYLLRSPSSESAAHLVAVARDVSETPQDLLTALFAGPNNTERSGDLRSALPPTARLLGAGVQSGLVVVNVSSDLQELSSDVLIDAVAQIVFTAAETGVEAVRIEIDGQARQWPTGSGELQSGPLTPYDFPGLVLSAQPDYPSTPSPEPTA